MDSHFIIPKRSHVAQSAKCVEAIFVPMQEVALFMERKDKDVSQLSDCLFYQICKAFLTDVTST